MAVSKAIRKYIEDGDFRALEEAWLTRLADARRRVNVSPLGAGALAGAGYPLDRETTAAELGFDRQALGTLVAVYLAMSGLPGPLVAASVNRIGVRWTLVN